MNEFLEMFNQYKECEFNYKGQEYFIGLESQGYILAEREPKFTVIKTFATLNDLINFSFFEGKSFIEVFETDIKIEFYG